MAELAVSRKQRLRTLEKEIREGMEEFYYTGMKLKEIRDDELYKEDGFTTWAAYLKERWEWSHDYARNLIIAAEYRQKLPSTTSGRTEWTERSVRELTRIEDKKEAARVAKKIVDRIEKEDGAKLTSSLVRKFVDEELGVTKAKPKPEPEENGDGTIDLYSYLNELYGSSKGTLEALKVIDDDAWTLFRRENPQFVKRLTTVWRALTDLVEGDEG